MKPIEHAYDFLVEARKIPGFATSDERLSDGWMIATIGTTHRDADTLTECNHDVLVDMLAEVDPDGSSHDTIRASHWGVGWVRHIIVDPANEAVLRVIGEAGCALEEYPILSESAYSEACMEAHIAGECGEDCEGYGEHCPTCHGPAEDHGYCDRHEPTYLAGCYGDSVSGHQHTRNRCADILETEGGDAELVAALRGEMSDDAWEQDEACDYLNAETEGDRALGTWWGWQDGDFGLWGGNDLADRDE